MVDYLRTVQVGIARMLSTNVSERNATTANIKRSGKACQDNARGSLGKQSRKPSRNKATLAIGEATHTHARPFQT